MIYDVTHIEHEIVGETEAGEYKFKFTNTDFNDIILSIGGIEFIEGDDEANMKFDYDIYEGSVPEERSEEFKNLLGDFIIQSIEQGIKNNDLIYTGGVDENRTDNFEQFGV
jgi:hypothetical protein